MAVFQVGDEVMHNITQARGRISKIEKNCLFIDWVDMGMEYIPREQVKCGPFEPTQFSLLEEYQEEEEEIPRFAAIAGELKEN